jgi:hypothetical protein
MIVVFIRNYFTWLGTLWLLLEIFNRFIPRLIDCDFGCFIAFAALMTFIDGFFVEGFLRFKIKINSNITDTKVNIKFGDVFNEKGWKAIAVNDFFDSKVDDYHVAKNSLHGQILTNFWSTNTADWDQQIETSLKLVTFNEMVRPSGKVKRYPIGTTAKCIQENNKFLCTVLSQTNIDNCQTSCELTKLYQAICGLCQSARTVCAGTTLSIPLFGSGLSRTGLPPNILLNTILAAIIAESTKSKITEEITIVLPWRFWRKINLAVLKNEWH